MLFRSRKTKETVLNKNSSRSALIIVIDNYIILDLMGSEKVDMNDIEGINANKTLLALTRVIIALSNKNNHVPYRESVLTTYIGTYLKTNTCVFIGCIDESDIVESKRTTDFINRLKTIILNPKIGYQELDNFEKLTCVLDELDKLSLLLF